MENKNHTHDCTKCMFIGSKNKKDFYICADREAGAKSLRFVIRHSSEPSDNSTALFNDACDWAVEGNQWHTAIELSVSALNKHLVKSLVK